MEVEVIEAQKRRDRLDSRRTLSPLALAEDMIRIDTTRMSLQEVVEVILRRIEDRAD